MQTVAIATLGCKVNQFESEALMFSLQEKGYRLIPFGSHADITIINTCTVTHRADFQSRQMVRRALRQNPGTVLVVTGCYAQVEPEILAAIEGVNHVIGNSLKNRLPELLPLILTGQFPKIEVDEIEREVFLSEIPPPSFQRHTRALLKIQDGCDGRCSYCIVPRARGRSRSLRPREIIASMKLFKEKGFREVVLTGVHIGAYGRDLQPSTSLEGLLQEVEGSETPDRIRLSSIEPLDFTPALISHLSTSEKICPHLHIPIQSGEDWILKRMNRGYDRAFLIELVTNLHRSIPSLSIGADIIVGFPGETEERFAETEQLIKDLPFSYLHVFPFSRRKGTEASHLPQQVDRREIKARAERLRELGREKRLGFYRQLLGREVKVLVEERRGRETKSLKGFTRNYVPVFLAHDGTMDSEANWVNLELWVRITDLKENGVVGRIIE